MVELPGTAGMPAMITRGPDDAMWFTLNRAGAIGRIDTAGTISVHPLPDPACGPVGITSDGSALWFTEIGAGRVGRMEPGGALQEFDLPDRSARPHAITPAPDGGCWLSLWGADAVGHLGRGGDTTVVELAYGDEPHGITVDPEGRVWVALESGFLCCLEG
jgi:virginiamycin B lyase